MLRFSPLRWLSIAFAKAFLHFPNSLLRTFHLLDNAISVRVDPGIFSQNSAWIFFPHVTKFHLIAWHGTMTNLDPRLRQENIFHGAPSPSGFDRRSHKNMKSKYKVKKRKMLSKEWIIVEVEENVRGLVLKVKGIYRYL